MAQKEVYKNRNKNVKVSRHNITETDSDSVNQEPNILLPFEKIKRELLIKRKAETTNKFGCDPDKRPIKELLNYGIINIDKSAGPTSHQVSAYVQQILKIDKSGHSGTLDPLVTGVLPTAIGRATRVVQMLLTAGKEYIAIMHLHKPVSEPEIRKVCEEFVGKIMQLPPVKSSVKREIRERNIYYLEILEIDGQDVLFKTGTQAGTYIRKLIHDLGEKIQGAHMLELRRTQAGIFKEDTLVNLYDFEKAVNEYNQGNSKQLEKMLIPAETALKQIMPSIQVPESLVKQLLLGKPLFKEDISKLPKEDIFSVFCKERFIGVYHEVEDKNIIAKPSFVYN